VLVSDFEVRLYLFLDFNFKRELLELGEGLKVSLEVVLAHCVLVETEDVMLRQAF